MKRIYRRRPHETAIHKKNLQEQNFFGVQQKHNFFTSLFLNGKGQSLPKSGNAFFSSKMNYDFSDVKIHIGKEAAASAASINAKAYTIGNDVVFNEGKYDMHSYEGKTLLAHELVHVMQQNPVNKISRKNEDNGSNESCAEGSVDLEAYTSAGYNKGSGEVVDEKTERAKGCKGCKDNCVKITGNLNVPFDVDTKIQLPAVSKSLTECQQDKVRRAIQGPLLAHENEHVAAFETFNGTASLPVNYKGCENKYQAHLHSLADKEFKRRKSAAQKKSDALDPFMINVDLCCKDKSKK